MDENDLTNEEIADITEGHEVNPLDDMVVYEVVSEHRQASNPTQAINSYPHIFIKLCDGEIINAENGERIINLSQFMTANGINETINTEEYISSKARLFASLLEALFEVV